MLKIKQVLYLPYTLYQTLVRWYGTLPVVIVLLVAFICGVVIIFNIVQNSSADQVETQNTVTSVTTTTAGAYGADFSGTLIGTAVAVTEATLLTERGGQVTRVPVTLGQFVTAGTVLASFANDSERASLTQARGAYESALASAQQSALSITDAQNAETDVKRALVTTHNNAQASVTSIITGSIDVFFSNPNNQIPGLRINGYSNTNELSRLRVTLREQLEVWQQNTTTISLTGNSSSEIAHARDTIRNAVNMVNIFISIFQQERGDSQYSLEDYREFITSFTTIRTNLNGLLSSLATAESNLVSAQENIARANLGGGTSSSLASAGITQARGALQAAEANFNKTIIRAPISGTIATLAVRNGDFASPQTLVAKITNTDGVEITTFISENERTFFTVGDEIAINDNATGTISAISPTLNSSTQKIEVRIAVTDTSISPGSTVTLKIPQAETTEVSTQTPITIPITAIKFTNTDGVVFVVENDTLVAREVTLGNVSGSMVNIIDGIDRDTEFVVAARGKNAGEQVVVTRK